MPFDASVAMNLAHGLSFSDLYTTEGAARIDRAFIDHLRAVDASLVDRLLAARFLPNARAPIGESALLIALGPHLEDFLASLFDIENEVRALEARHHELAPLFAVKRSFVQRKALNAHKADAAATFDGAAMRRELEARLGVPLEGQAGELAFANAVNGWQHDAVAHAADLDLALRYAAWATLAPEGRAAHRGGVLFRAPRKLDYMNLVPVEVEVKNGVNTFSLENGHVRRREGFALTDPAPISSAASTRRITASGATSRARIPARMVFPRKSPPTARRSTIHSRRPFSASRLPAVPLEEKISEFHKLRAEGWPLRHWR
jgi:hypothetical protein